MCRRPNPQTIPAPPHCRHPPRAPQSFSASFQKQHRPPDPPPTPNIYSHYLHPPPGIYNRAERCWSWHAAASITCWMAENYCSRPLEETIGSGGVGVQPAVQSSVLTPQLQVQGHQGQHAEGVSVKVLLLVYIMQLLKRHQLFQWTLKVLQSNPPPKKNAFQKADF